MTDPRGTVTPSGNHGRVAHDIRPHTFTPDVGERPNHRGERPCSVCPLPKLNRIHRDPPEDDSARILGESSSASGDA